MWRLLAAVGLIVMTLVTRARAAPAVSEVWVFMPAKKSPAEWLLVESIQGLANRHGPRVWVAGQAMSGIILEELKQEGTAIHEVASPWDLLKQFRSDVKGMVICKVGTESVNTATTLCGVKDAVLIDESLVGRARQAGLFQLADARRQDDLKVINENFGGLGKQIAVEQDPNKAAHLRDWAIENRAATFYGIDAKARMDLIKRLGPGTSCYGWGGDEYGWIDQISRGGGVGIVSDYSQNLSAMSQVPAGELKQKRRPDPAPVKAGERIVAFVMSDGDNVQWMAAGMPTDNKYFASPHRGEFSMTWEVPPSLVTLSPRTLRYLYAHASEGDRAHDDFVTGPSGIGYLYPHQHLDLTPMVERTADAMQKADLQIVTVLNGVGGSMEETKPYLDLPNVLGVIYKDYNAYNGRHGAVWWDDGKPCVAYRFLLWEKIDRDSSVEGLADAIARMPADPEHDQNSYAMINVHAWSYKEIGGAMEATKRVVEKLPPGTRVVTAGELMTLLRENFGKPVGK